MKLIHYSSGKIESIYSKRYIDEYIEFSDRHRYWAKPSGLWVSVEDHWKIWCEMENFKIEDLKFAHEIILKKYSKILFLENDASIFKFSQKYRVSKDFHRIKWLQLMNEYQGIVISPYSSKCRLHPKTIWYYGWDCASGCIWDLESIESFSIIEN